MKGILIATPISLVLWFLILWVAMGLQVATYAVASTLVIIVAMGLGGGLYYILNKQEFQKL